jgi:dimethylargininase
MFTNAIVRTPCQALVEGITTARLGVPDYSRALEQHAAYTEALKACGLTVTVLPADENFPDSTFVEDTALLTPHCAIITNPGAESRRGEIDAMIPVVEDLFDRVEFIDAPGTVEAGDVMMVGDHYYIGLSARTNHIGAMQMITFLEKHGMGGSIVSLSEVLHLKTGLSYLENNNLLVCGEFIDKPEFAEFNRLIINSDEAYAANSLWVNDTVIVPHGFPSTQKLIEAAGYETITVDVSEFQKIDGGLSCLSLRF